MSPSVGGVYLYYLLYFLVVAVQGPPSGEPSCINPGNFWQAKQCCMSRGSQLPGIPQDKIFSYLRKSLVENKINSTWIRTRRNMMSNWKWIDGKVKDISPRTKNEDGCGLYNQRTKRVESGLCSDKTAGSICSFNSSQCPSGLLTFIGVSHKGVCYVHYCERLSWHEARAHCQIQGFSLAEVRDPELVEVLSQKTWACNRFWIGLRREEWIDNLNSPVNIIYDHWNPHHHPDTGCGRVQLTKTSWIFIPEMCNISRPYICDVKEHVLTVTQSQNKSFAADGISRGAATVVLSICIPLTVLCVVVLVISVWCWKEYKRNNQNDLAEMKSLLQKGERKSIMRYLQHHVAREILMDFNYTEVWDWEDENSSVELDQLYTDLVYAERRGTQLGQEEESLEYYTDMLSHRMPGGFQHRVYIEGAAGTGKTTLSKRLLVDWARYILAGWWRRTFLIPQHIKKQLGQFNLVLPIFLRDVIEGQSLAEAVFQSINLDEVPEGIEQIIVNDQRNILFLCEGLDEYREETSPEITGLLKLEKLKQTNLLITSRNPPNLHFKTKKELPATHVILKGFSDKGVECYTDRFFRGTKTGSLLRKEIMKSDDRKALSRYPAVLLLMCVLWRDTETIADSVTKFYLEFLKYICGRYERKYHVHDKNGPQERTRKYVSHDDKDPQEDMITRYHGCFMEIGEIAVEGLRGKTLELNFHLSVLNDLSDSTSKLGFFNLQRGDENRKKSKKKVSFQHKTFQEFMAAYYIVHCEAIKRYKLLLDFVSSPNAIKEATMLVTFLQGLGKDMITNLVHGIIEGPESDAAKTNTAVQLAFLMDAKEGSFALPGVIELELREHYTSDVLQRYFSMDFSAVTKIIIWGSSIQNLKYLGLIQRAHLNEVILYHLETGFIRDFDFDRNRNRIEIEIETLNIEGFRRLTAKDILLLCNVTSYKSGVVFVENQTKFSFNPKNRWGNRNVKVLAKKSFVQASQIKFLDLTDNDANGDFLREIGSIPFQNIFPSLKDIRLGKCVILDASRKLLDNINKSTNLEVLDLSGVFVSTDVCNQIAEQLQGFANLREFYLCKCDTENATEPLIKNLECMLEILDISGNIYEPEPYEVLDVRGRTTGNRVTSYVYHTLGDRMTSLTKLHELRLCECDEPWGLVPVVESLHHVTQLQALDLSGNNAGLEVFKLLGEQLKHLSKLKLLRLCVSSKMNAVRHVVDKIHLVTELNILDISGIKAKFAKRNVFQELYSMSNSVDETVYQVLGDQLHHLNDLRELRLCNCKDVDAIKPVITGLRHTTKLHTLDLLGNEVEYDVFTEIGRLSRLGELRELRLCYCRDNNAVGIIVNHLYHTPGLVVLDLRGEMVSGEERRVKKVNKNTADRGVYETLGRQLQHLPRLRELRVCECHYDARGEGVAVVDGLQYTPGLQVLQMGRWSLDAAGVEQLGERLVNLREMRQLLLGHCDVYDMGDIQPDASRKYVQLHKAWNKCVSQLSMMSQLQVVNLDNINIGNESVVQLSRQLSSLTHLDTLIMFRCGLTDTQTVIQLIDALPSCPSLRRLDVSENKLDDGLEQIVNMTQQLSQLYWLDFEYNKMSGSVAENIKRQLKQELPDLTLRV